MVSFCLQLSMAICFALTGHAVWTPGPVMSVCSVMFLDLRLSGFMRCPERPNLGAAGILYQGVLVSALVANHIGIGPTRGVNTRGFGLIHWANVRGAYRLTCPYLFI